MLVKNWMSTNVICIGADDNVQKATKLQKENNIGMLPVIDKGRLVGVVTNRDIRSASVSDAIPLDISEAIYLATKIKVRKIMTPYPFTVSSEQTMEEAADMLLKNAISGAPVVDDKGDIVGVITRSDALRVLMSVVSGDKVGYQFAFSLSDRPGATSEIIKVVHNYNARIASILSSYQRVARGFRNVYMRVYDLEPDKLPQLLNELRGKFTVDYVVDFITNKREIYQK